MEFAVEDFRCFHQPTPIAIRPINLLVGENSAGKTSFLAALRFTLEFLKRQSPPSFNKDPFYLGAFDQIAHFRGGRFGRAKSFSFQVIDEIPKPLRFKRQLELPHTRTRTDPQKFKLKVTFHDYKSQPAAHLIEFTAGDYGFSLRLREQIELAIKIPNMKEYIFRDAFIAGRLDYIQDVASYADFALRDLRFLTSRSDSTGDPVSPDHATHFFQEVEYISELYRRIQRTVPQQIYASAPVRSKPERTYNVQDSAITADGRHIPYIIAELHSFEPDKWQKIQKSIDDFGRASGLFSKVQIKRISNNPSGPFQLVITQSGSKANLMDVGYGVSQALPIVTDTLRMNRGLFLFQQPEVHLHPKAQAELGSFFAHIAKEREHTFFIETHSDYLLDRVRMEVRAGTITPDDVGVLFFEKCDHDVEIHSLTLDEAGNVLGAPKSYRRFFLEEEANSLGLPLE